MGLSGLARDYVEQLFKDKLSEVYLYHNFIHTAFVVSRAQEIIDHTEISPAESEKIILALWFHDTGYTQSADHHEEKSVAIMRRFLQDHGADEAYIAEISRLILATQRDHIPQDLAEKIVKDSDYGHFGSEDYKEIAERLREELELTGQCSFSKKEWYKTNLQLLKNNHVFYTDYALKNWQPVKEKNIRKTEKEVNKEEEKKKNGKKKTEPEKEAKADRSVDTLFRITLNNHTRLSDIADSKANILLSVNAIVISVCLSVLVPKLDAPKNSHLIIPTFTLLLFSVCTIIFAILSTKPNVTKAKFSMQDVRDRKVNMLFFGNFFRIPMNDYMEAMEDLVSDRKYIYDSMMRDLYFLGKVLDRKYRLLSITYKIFMLGIIVSVLAFAYAFMTL